MSRVDFLSSLNLMTLVVAVLIAAIGLALFLRRRSNRHSMEGREERNVAADLDAGQTAPEHSARK